MQTLWLALWLPDPAADAARQAGMPSGEASPAILAAFWERLQAWAYGFSDHVCQDGKSTLWLEAGGSLRLFGQWPAFERRLRGELAALSVTHRLAGAPTLLGAQLLARHHDGLALPDATMLSRTVADLPLASPPLCARDHQRLREMGLGRWRDLLALPRDALAKRFGRSLGQTVDRLLGEAPDPRDFYQPPSHFEARFDFDGEITRYTGLLFPLKRLLGDLALHLRCRDRGVERFSIVLEHDRQPATVLTIGLRRPERDASALLSLSRLRIERSQWPAPVVALRIEASNLPPFIPGRRDLFDLPVGEGLDFGALRDRLCARLGPQAMHSLRLQPDLRPEHRQQPGVPGHAHGPFPPRPTWLLPQPQPWPESDPMILTGPERIESGWWDGVDIRRDYYVVQSRQGQRAWVFCDSGKHGPYWLHGWFA